jgi:hypothetical protein
MAALPSLFKKEFKYGQMPISACTLKSKDKPHGCGTDHVKQLSLIYVCKIGLKGKFA